MIPFALLALSGCLAVGAANDQILAGDLAIAYPEWAAVPKDTPLALAPLPGVERVFHVMELRRIAQRWNVTPAPDRDLCVARPVAMATPDALLTAMRKALPEAHIELIEFSRAPAPEGELVFPLSGLQQSPGGGFWHGYVQYAGTRRFAVWARVKVQVTAPRVVANEDLKLGAPVTAAQLRVETREEAYAAARFPSTIEDVAGQAPRHAIPAGSVLRADWLEPPKAVLRGETVVVEVVSGAAHLKLEARAETPGAIGDTIVVTNPVSKRRFSARVEAKGRAVVDHMADTLDAKQDGSLDNKNPL
jgi:flagella basal body P-ring formation protein FlgA